MRPTWLMWINPDDYLQLAWAGQYLARKGYPNFVLANGYPIDGATFIEGMARYEQDRAFRYCVDKMRAAWRQKQYRTRNGQQTAFQLPNQVRANLARLAKAQRKTKVETLRQVISDAADQHDHEKKEVKKAKEAHKKKVQHIETKHAQEIAGYRRFSAYLLDALDEELSQRCCLEALVGEWDDSPLTGKSMDAYHALVEKRIKELENGAFEMRSVRPGGRTLRERMKARATRP